MSTMNEVRVALCVTGSLFLLLASLPYRGFSQLSTYGEPPYCLFSQPEVMPCTFRFPNRAQKPGYNQVAEYSTRITSNSAGFPKCTIRNNGQRVLNISTLRNDDRIKFIFSPGRRSLPPNRYGNQIMVQYNISCPADHLIYFNITFIELEQPNCYDVLNNRTVCQDFVRIIRPSYGYTEVCGTDYTDFDSLETGNIEILLRTNDAVRYPGFEGIVICYDPLEITQSGCTRHENRKRNTGERFSSQEKEDLHLLTTVAQHALTTDREHSSAQFMEALSDAAIMAAIKNVIACDSILRTIARAIYNLLLIEYPLRLNQLLASAMVTETADVTTSPTATAESTFSQADVTTLPTAAAETTTLQSSHKVECLANNYLETLSTGENVCVSCPDNSISTVPNSPVCTCYHGYYRTHLEKPNTPCTTPPSACRNLELDEDRTRANTITVRWERPEITGRDDFYYNVFYSEDNQTFTQHNTRRYIKQSFLVDYSLSGLKPFTSYTIRVMAENGVSDQVEGGEARSCELTTKTGDSTSRPSAPSLVRGLCSCSVVVWRAPDRAYGSITGYDVNFVPFGLRNVTISKGYQDLFHVISDDEVPMNIRGNTTVQVRAKVPFVNGEWSKLVSLGCTS